jgi:pSer/pThr/pTyr-binding forkhead associated (FHA) protein
MPFKLKITKETDPSWNQEYSFDKETVRMGRDPANELQLGGAGSGVSRLHTQIIQQGDTFKIIDNNSLNFTFLNNEKLKAGIEYDLKDEDEIKICDFIIRFSIEVPVEEDLDATVFGKDFINPFIDDVETLAKTVDAICTIYEKEESGRKREVLIDALNKEFGELKSEEAREILAHTLSPQTKTTELPPDFPAKEAPIQHRYGQIQGLMDTLMELLVKFIQARRQFRLEFMGETMIKLKKTFSLSDCTLEELKDYILNPDIPAEETQKRIEKIKAITNELLIHQLSMLEGYKSSAKEGTQKILDKLSPDLLREEPAAQKAARGKLSLQYKIFPFLASLKLSQLITDAHRELTQEDQGIIEKKYFRPSYIKSYNKRTDLARKTKGDQ